MNVSLTLTVDPDTNVRQRTFQLLGHTYTITMKPSDEDAPYALVGAGPDFLAQLVKVYPHVPEESLEEIASLMDGASDEADLIELLEALSETVGEFDA
jgi:hypothetical protein